MPEFFIILFKINFTLLLFGLAYFLLLRRLTFYRLNRVYLVVGIVFSSLYPFLNLAAFFQRHPKVHEQISSVVPHLDNPISVKWSWLFIAFLSGVFIFLLRLIVQFFSLHRLHKRSRSADIAGFKVRVLEEPISPFSFWRSVYINPTLHAEQELQTILEHENIHIREWHTIDILLTELSVVFYWFNPGMWMVKKAVKENLEFITDEKVLGTGVNRKAYQYSLLEVGNLKPATLLVNNFSIPDLKRRIRMMNLRPSSSVNLGRYILLLPLLSVLILAFTIPSFKNLTTIKLVQAVSKKPVSPVPAPEPSAPSAKSATSAKLRVIIKQKAKEIRPSVPRNETALDIRVLPSTSVPQLDEERANQALLSVKKGIEIKPQLEEITVIGYSSKSRSAKPVTESPKDGVPTKIVIGMKIDPEKIDKINKGNEEAASRPAVKGVKN